MENWYYSKIEPISGILRIYLEKRDDSVHNSGIPFLISLTVRWIDPYMVEIMGLSFDSKEKDDKKLNKYMFKSIMTECKRWNIKTIVYFRYKYGKKIKKEFSVEKYCRDT